MNVTKKDNTQEPWDTNKIKVAIRKAAERCKCPITDFSIERVILGVLSEIKDKDSVSVSELHSLVIHYLAFENFPEISKAYQEYRDYKNTYTKAFEAVKNEADTVLLLGDKENANFDSSLVSTKGSLIKGYLTKELYRQFYLSKEEKELVKRGDIYIHDLRDMIFGSINCFDRNTKFITSQGLKSFNDFNDGDTVTVLTAKGNWKPATVHCYGKQSLNKVGIKRSRGQEVYVYATKNHRWILNNNSETTDLKVGDILCNTPKVSTFKWDSLSIENKTYWCLGFLFGDGTQSHSTACSIRLCGDKSKYASRFKECGFTVTTPNNKGWSGDNLVWMHDTSKSLPPINHMTVENIKLFINGLLCADGGKDLRSSHRDFRSLQVSGEYCDAIYSMLHTAGYYVNSVADLTAQETNYAIRRKNTKQFKIYENATERTAWRVSSIEPANVTTDVWCLNVEDDHSFILEHGIPTGNCCLFDIGNVLRGGFSMSNVDYTEPTSVLSALQVIGDITLVATAQQFGGFSLSQLDMVLLPYCEKTLKKAYKHAKHCFPDSDPSSWDLYARRVLKDELKQGFQSLELKLNTVPCSRGDFAFTTISFGCWNAPQWLGRYLNDTDLWILKEICSAILNTRMNGHGENHKPVVFPKLVYLYEENYLSAFQEARDVFELAIECSSKCMYPDFLSLTGDWAHSSVGKQYMENKQVVTPMGA
jgi:phosphopantetheine adenylyltransferase